MRNSDIRLGPAWHGDQPFVVKSTGYVTGSPGDQFDWTADDTLVEGIVKGRGRLSVGNRSWDAGDGEVYVLHRVNARYRSDPSDPWVKVFCVIAGRLVDLLCPMYLGQQTIFRAADVLPLLMRVHELNEHAPADTHERASILLHEILVKLGAANERNEPYPAGIRDVRGFIDRHYTERMTVSTLADRAGVSKAHLIRTFRRCFGNTPYDYIIQRRIDAATAMLSRSTLHVQEIADRLGFADAFYFSNAFKKRIGVSPSEYRRRHTLPKRESE